MFQFAKIIEFDVLSRTVSRVLFGGAQVLLCIQVFYSLVGRGAFDFVINEVDFRNIQYRTI